MEWLSGADTVHGPTWSELVDRATEQLGFQNPDLARVRGTDLQILEYYKLLNGGQIAKLTNWLTKLMSPPDAALVASPILAELVQMEKCNLIYTTNYDDFIERAYVLAGKSARTIVLESQMGMSTQAVDVVKFHGDLNHPGQIVLTEGDYEGRLTFNSPLDYRLQADLLGRVVLFLGYSFRDPNVSYLFSRVTQPLENDVRVHTQPRAYIALPDPSEFEYSLFRKRRIDVVPLEGSTITADVAMLLKELRS